MCCFYHTSNTINLVTATKYTAFGVIEYCVFVKDLIDCSATTHGVIFAKYVAQITKQQGRYAVGHRVLRFRSWTASHPTLANFMTFVVATLAFFNLNSRVGFCGFWLSGAPNLVLAMHEAGRMTGDSSIILGKVRVADKELIGTQVCRVAKPSCLELPALQIVPRYTVPHA